MFDILEILKHPAWRGIGGLFALLSLLAYLIVEKDSIFNFSGISHHKKEVFKIAVFIFYVVVSLVCAFLPHMGIFIHMEYLDNYFYGILVVVFAHIFSCFILFFTILLV